MLTREEREVIEEFVIKNPYIPHVPFENQARFLALPHREALYGGAAGGGKSDALLMAALMFVNIPDYHALLFRRTYSDLALPGAILPRSHEWLGGTDAKWNGSEMMWHFPSGATLGFGYLAHETHKYRYQSSELQFIGFDELTQFESEHYTYLFSRLRRLHGVSIPLRMRGATNPGGRGHHWVFERFIANPEPDRPFIASKLWDNNFIDQEEYRAALAELDEVTRRQLELGEWITDPTGKPFNREWWTGKNRFVPGGDGGYDPVLPLTRWISLDTALEDKARSDYTAWTVAEIMPDYTINILEVGRERLTFPDLIDLTHRLNRIWNYDHKLRGIIIEGAASGKPAIQSLRSGVDKDLAARVIEFVPRTSKIERANAVGIWCKRGMVKLPHPGEDVPWLDEFFSELVNFPDVEYDDRTDSFVQLLLYLENYLASGWAGLEARREAAKPMSRVQRALQAAGRSAL